MNDNFVRHKALTRGGGRHRRHAARNVVELLELIGCEREVPDGEAGEEASEGDRVPVAHRRPPGRLRLHRDDIVHPHCPDVDPVLVERHNHRAQRGCGGDWRTCGPINASTVVCVRSIASGRVSGALGRCAVAMLAAGGAGACGGWGGWGGAGMMRWE